MTKSPGGKSIAAKPLVLVGLTIVFLITSACGTAVTSTSPSNSSTTKSQVLTVPTSTTSSTLALTPNRAGIAPLCSAYFQVVSDYFLLPQIAQQSASQISSGQSLYLADISTLKNKASITQDPTLVPALDQLTKLKFTPSAQGSTPTKINFVSALTSLQNGFATLCGVTHPTSPQSSAITNAAIAAGMTSSCAAASTITISSADPSFAVDTVSSQTTSKPACFKDGSIGVVLRVQDISASFVQTFVTFPCGQMAPAILDSLFGTKALTLCYPGPTSPIPPTGL
ncbi:hypothetical protein [Acidithrix sp. C25]|uniref:hypothetical protein n=1 Tax=Acidithrix sp. C25 TaxID=1671482 RepID=UPI00191B8FE5|nr:hypothetical protein [Acidithrix sp. C25]